LRKIFTSHSVSTWAGLLFQTTMPWPMRA
jgi:hypothetical protein